MDRTDSYWKIIVKRRLAAHIFDTIHLKSSASVLWRKFVVFIVQITIGMSWGFANKVFTDDRTWIPSQDWISNWTRYLFSMLLRKWIKKKGNVRLTIQITQTSLLSQSRRRTWPLRHVALCSQNWRVIFVVISCVIAIGWEAQCSTVNGQSGKKRGRTSHAYKSRGARLSISSRSHNSEDTLTR